MKYISKLYPKQLEILKQIKDYSLLPLGTATGKTLIALHYYINNHLDKPLVIYCPLAKYLEGGWVSEFNSLKSKYNLITKDITVVPYSQINKYTVADNSFVILDEAHYIKNPMAKRSKAIREILNNKPFIMLSATPGTKVEDYCHYFMLWNKFKYKTHFEREFLIKDSLMLGARNIPVVKGYKNLDKFSNVLKQYSTSRLTVNDIVELPELIIKDVSLTPSKEYKDIKKNRILQLDNDVILLDTQIKLCTYLRQYVSPKEKISNLEDIISECKQLNENLLIFYNFKSELRDIEKLVKIDYIINGDVKIFPSKEDFKNLNSKITVVQIRAGGTGIELQYNSQVLFYSPTYSYQDYEQALGRAYRPGQNKKVLVRRFNTINTIEADVWEAIKNKKDFDEKMWK